MGIGLVQDGGCDLSAVSLRPPAKKRRGEMTDLEFEPLRTGSECVVKIECDRLTVHDAPASPPVGANPEMPRSQVPDSDPLIQLEGRLENDRRRLNLPIVRAPGKNWRVAPDWVRLFIETPALTAPEFRKRTERHGSRTYSDGARPVWREVVPVDSVWRDGHLLPTRGTRGARACQPRHTPLHGAHPAGERAAPCGWRVRRHRDRKNTRALGATTHRRRTCYGTPLPPGTGRASGLHRGAGCRRSGGDARRG